MQAVARLAILIFIFTIPWENMIVLPGFGTISRAAGAAAFALAVLAFMLQPQFRNLKAFHVLFLVLVLFSAISYAWSVDATLSMNRIRSNLQLLLFVWMLWQFVETERELLACFQAYVLGALLAASGTIMAWLGGVQVVYMRYSAEGFDPNELALILALAVPLAWYLSLRQSSSILAWANRLMLPALLAAILLTGSRTGVVVAGVGFLYVLSTVARGTVVTRIAVAVVVVACSAGVAMLIPDSTWARLGTLHSEIASGTLNNRLTIWAAGLGIWLDNLALGVGAGAFRAATQLAHGYAAAPHNSFLSILVELGTVGFLLFLALVYAIWRSWLLLPSDERRLYLALGLILSLGLFTLTWETKKPLWLLCSFIVCHAVARLDGRSAEQDTVVVASVADTSPGRLLQTKAGAPLLGDKPPQTLR